MSLAIYRLPYSETYTEVRYDGEPILLDTIEDLANREGFVISPFVVEAKTPLLLIPTKDADISEHCFLCSNVADERKQNVGTTSTSEDYRKNFLAFHSAIEDGRFKKLVLARTAEKHISECDLFSLYEKICKNYPRAMVMLFDTPQSGTWIIASPEILLEQQKSIFRTMALAGTMPYDEGLPQWSEKNKHEQNIVERYIENTISPICNQIIKDGPRTVRAGNLMHLRTDFRFHLNDGCSMGELLGKLHPTPAVCGLPKQEALEFIIKNESINREYYSGFAGPLNIKGETHLYVSLRCMKIDKNHITAFAGGGIMAESNADEEWKETELKLITNVLQ